MYLDCMFWIYLELVLFNNYTDFCSDGWKNFPNDVINLEFLQIGNVEVGRLMTCEGFKESFTLIQYNCFVILCISLNGRNIFRNHWGHLYDLFDFSFIDNLNIPNINVIIMLQYSIVYLILRLINLLLYVCWCILIVKPSC